jgi:hypothetical protein
MIEGELTVVVRKMSEGEGSAYWHGQLLYNDDSVSEATGPDFNSVVDLLMDYAQTENNVIDQEWFNN